MIDHRRVAGKSVANQRRARWIGLRLPLGGKLASCFFVLAALALCEFAQPQAALGQAEAAEKPAELATGRLLRVPLPLTGDVDTRVKTSINRYLNKVKRGGSRPVLILELSPGQAAGGRGSEFGRAHDLASFLTGPALNGIKTVAYIPKSVSGHGVLIAMACEEIVMAPGAELGDAGIDEARVTLAMRSSYAEIADARKTIPKQLALAMLDKNHQVYKVVTAGEGAGEQYVDAAELEQLAKTKKVIDRQKIAQPAIFSANEARNVYGFASFLAKDREELAKALRLPVDDLRPDPSLDRDWVACQVKIDQPLHGEMVNRAIRLIDDQVRAGEVNFVCVRIESGGGSIEASIRLATYLAELDPSKVTTVAYIAKHARGDAALIALACDQIVMHGAAKLGGAPDAPLNPELVAPAIQTFRAKVIEGKAKLAGRTPRSWSLPASLVDPSLAVFAYTNAAQGQVDYFTAEELAAQPKPDQWQQGNKVTPGPGSLMVDGKRGEELGLITTVVDSFEGFKEHYGLRGDPALLEPSWAHSLILALGSERLSLLLLVIGIAAVYGELQTPGLGIGAFIALVCFLLYFWAKHLNGTAGWLEVLLFMAGMGCLLLEVFIIPGFGIFGLGGGIMVITSLVLASQTFVLPRNDYQFDQLRNSLLGLAGASVGTFALIMVLRQVLPHTPVFNRMVLEPPRGDELQNLDDRESLVNLRHLVGRHGQTTTPLMPSGKALFDDELVNVIASGAAIERGVDIVVVQVQGNRVLVKAAETA